MESLQLFVFIAKRDKKHLIFLDRAVSPDASLFQSGAQQSGEKKGKKKEIGREGREEGFFPVSPAAPNAFFLLAFLCAVPT